jgi:large subunit ribosomal protein L29
MKIAQIKEMTDAELANLLEELQKERLNLKIQSKTGQLENPARFKQIRKDIARIKTVTGSRVAEAAASAQ